MIERIRMNGRLQGIAGGFVGCVFCFFDHDVVVKMCDRGCRLLSCLSMLGASSVGRSQWQIIQQQEGPRRSRSHDQFYLV
jgi:hypothetical protein